ncbi:ATP-binding protein [Microvenator marinus]|uniref:ATP-binding protein n=1 Tax=Microvenator marinus TaxID=2600177 RepID=UPI00201B5C94|nr:ATP-binding protein [Microvenator marinus]
MADPVVDEAEIQGNVSGMLRHLEEKLRSHNRVNVDVTSNPTHSFVSPYPHAALQQIVYNAVLHRTYERTNAPIRVYWFNDRIEVNSPGGPYGNVTPQNFGEPGVTDYRNPNLADVLKIFGFVQSFGRGIAIARRAMENNGNPPLEFEVTPSAVLATLRR